MPKYHLITYGCQMNQADSERIAAALKKKGYKSTLKIESADLVVVNMCSVRQSAVDRIWGKTKELTKLKKEKPKIKTILTGCITKPDRKKLAKLFDQIWQNQDYLETLPKCQKKSVAFVPISNGCNNACAYCVVPYTRGKLVCRNHKKIIKEFKRAATGGAKEIWLLGQNVNDYTCPSDKTVDFAGLLKMTNDLAGDFKIRFMSPNPKNFTQELINVMTKSKKVAKFLNLPVQSGDDDILKKMNRPYGAKLYETLVKKIRQKIPDINLSTDVIVGFPGETKKQFENTVKLFKKINFDIAYISKYSARPGTLASKLKDTVSLEEKKRRAKILMKLVKHPCI
jgi:tRNA-2-methylthio-N6-dimethylallyladenosine synthase